MSDTTAPTGPFGGFTPADLADKIHQAIDTAAPVEIFKGHAGIFATPAGGLVVAFRSKYAPDDSQDQHLELPGALVKLLLAQANGGGNPLAMMRSMMG